MLYIPDFLRTLAAEYKNIKIMKVRVKIDGYIDVVDENVTVKQIEEAVKFSLGLGSLSADNPVGDPDWGYAIVEVV